jgi:hypothetical protein
VYFQTVLNGQDYCTTSCGIHEEFNMLGVAHPRTIPTLAECIEGSKNHLHNGLPVVTNLELAKTNWTELKNFWLFSIYDHHKFVRAIHAELVQKYQLVESRPCHQSPLMPMVRARGGLAINGRATFYDSGSDDEDSRYVVLFTTYRCDKSFALSLSMFQEAFCACCLTRQL